MYGVSFYIEPKDILNKLSEEDKMRFNECVFTDVVRDPYGSGVSLYCVLFNSEDKIENSGYRYKLMI